MANFYDSSIICPSKVSEVIVNDVDAALDSEMAMVNPVSNILIFVSLLTH